MSSVQSLKDSGLKATLPRRKILELFEASKVRHLSAEDVYKALIAEGIDIGLATVYRVLTQFEHAGLLSRQHFETGKAVDRKSTRLNSSHANISYAVFCLKKKKK